MDVLTFGETMLRLSPPQHRRLAQTANLEMWAAGSESNVAAGLCALGLSAAWVSRLPDNPVGRRIAADIAGRGVDVSSVVWASAEERAGSFFAEAPLAPRAGTVVYDRANSAATRLSPADITDSLFDSCRHLHLSGITPALSPSCAATVADAIARAKQRGMTVSFDVNYRAKLWAPEAAAEALAPLLPRVDILFCGAGDAVRLFGLSGSPQERARGLRERFGCPLVAVTAGAAGAAGCRESEIHSVPVFRVEQTVDRFGSGDAFAAGFLAVFLAGNSTLPQMLRLGAAAAALKRTTPGDMLIASRAEVEALALSEELTPWR